MTLKEAAANVGARVVYTPAHGARETGVIKAVGSRFVHVAYGNETTAKATRAEDLQFIEPKEVEA